MRCCDLLPRHDAEPWSGRARTWREWWRSPKRAAVSRTHRSADRILQCSKSSTAKQRTATDPRGGTQGWLGRYFLRPAGSPVSVLANALVSICQDERRSLRRGIHLRRQAVVRLRPQDRWIDQARVRTARAGSTSSPGAASLPSAISVEGVSRPSPTARATTLRYAARRRAPRP